MIDLLRILILAPLGYIAALVAAALTLGFAARSGLHLSSAGAFSVAGIVMVYIGAATFLPALAGLAVAELFRIRSAFYFVLFGGANGYVIHLVTPYAGPFGYLDSRGVAFAAAGFVGGLVYWLVAGRLSGIGGRGTLA